ncbi:MAG: B12-binding domain-containing radical SAM protein [Caldisphaeraceae archaeon]|nr:B12-binding domain-containing radical SAM protein [Caldisphaeraceae archaeon]MEB3797374.1 B12-binding domain-containing radical SAM protein [Caldisphaeraceae archaeon]
MKAGYKIVLTAEGATASDSQGSTVAGFISALPDNYMRPSISRFYFNVKNKDGVALRAPYGLSKVEASLVANGIPRDEIVIADPNHLDKFIGNRTKILGIYVMDPLGLSYGSGITYWILKLAGLSYRGLPFIARSFLNILMNDSVRKHRSHIKIVVGGAATWQLVDTGYNRKLGIDVVYEGEFESLGPKLFYDLLSGKGVPRIVSGRPAKIEEIKTILTPSNGGLVEVTRGCGRGCAFCTPTLSGMIRSLPFEGHIEKEIRVNIEKGGVKDIGLHSEEYFRYGANGIDPNPEKVLNLTKKAYKLVKSYGDDYHISTDFTTAAVVVQNPKLVEKVAEYINEGGRWTFIEVGIESGSPSIIGKLMRGKALPFTPEQYPDVVEEGIGILNDNRWVVVGTIILNLPGETEEDVMKTLELLDRIKRLKVITFPLPFIPMGALRHRDFTILDKMLNDPLRRELIAKALYKAMVESKSSLNLAVGKMENPLVRGAILKIGYRVMDLVINRYKRELERIEARKAIMEKHKIYSYSRQR